MSHIPEVTKIAVLRANGLGDYLFSVPALESVAAAYPGAELVLLGAPWHERFLSGRAGPVDRVMVAPALPGIRTEEPDDPVPARAAGVFLDQARTEGFDLAIQLHGGGRNSNPIVKALGARVTAGLRAPDAPPLDRWIRYVYYQPEVFRYLEVAGLVGAEPVTFLPRLALHAADRAEARTVEQVAAGAAPRVALHPGATDRRRRWPASNFAAVGDAAAAAGFAVVVTGTGPEASIVDEVIAAMRAPASPVVDAVSVGGLAALFAECAAVVANDTGPLHLAAAVGAPTVGIFWIGNLINAGPAYRRGHRPYLSWTLRCPVCGMDCNLGRCEHDDSFVTDVSPADVVEGLLDLVREDD